MPDSCSYAVGALAEVCGGRLADPASQADAVIRGVGTLDEAGPDLITWVSEGKHSKALATSRAGAIIGTEGLLAGDPRGIIVEDPELAIAQVLDCFLVRIERPAPGVHPTAVVHEAAELSASVAIGAHAVIQAEARIGENTVIHEGVSIGRAVHVGRDCEIYDRCVVYDRCEIGSRVIIHAGAVIGADGFGYIFRDGRHRKLAHLGTVVIEDDVEIGANSCIDRAKLGATRIGRGSKIDNLVMIAHNVQLGPLCVLVGQVGLSGSVRLGSGAALGGQSGVSQGIQLGDGVQVAAQSGVFKDVAPGQVVLGTPARDRMTVLRDQARVRRLPRLFEELVELKRRVAELEESADHRDDR
ncbi:MAG: UDP-3-O-(3-hydroxymyristoyl)glucosamine N-acyltransferase [Phycisphaerae bacterium]|nr:UDP-3-O-(3-hydroxymyristoyl)glucosamine N-acyltransferase [Phycisphaerae bacterium]